MKKLFHSAKFFSAGFALLIVFDSVAYAGGGGGGPDRSDWINLAWKTFDFAVLIGLLVWLFAARIKGFFVGRRKEIKETMEKANREKAEAEQKFKEYSLKIDKASAEIDVVFEMIKSQGVAEKQKIIEDAEKIAKKTKEDALARIEQELKKASAQLKIEAVQLSTQMAEEILKRNITVQDNEIIVREYMDKVVNKH